jgi:hypothetical protein
MFFLFQVFSIAGSSNSKAVRMPRLPPLRTARDFRELKRLLKSCQRKHELPTAKSGVDAKPGHQTRTPNTAFIFAQSEKWDEV